MTVVLSVQSFFSFPDTVNETSARLVAAGVVVQAMLFFWIGSGWLLVPLLYGFLARVLTGPTLSPLGQFATRVATPFVERFAVTSRRVPGPPKRFAQGIGLAFSSGAAVAWLLGAPVITSLLLAGLIGAALLESVAAYCLGCAIHQVIWGCDDCADLTERLGSSVTDGQPVPTV